MASSRTARKATNLTLSNDLLDEARSLEINLSRAAETGLKLAISEAKSELWKRENSEALESSNKWVEANGLPLDKYRQF
jgi:antitoxin CcdA